jgi:two-component system, OmpR family, sensor kinase
VPIRLRLTLVVAATTIALVAVGGLLGPRVLRISLVHAIDQDLARRAIPIGRAVTDPDDAEVDVGDLHDEVNRLPEALAQVLDGGGRVLASSAGLEKRPLVPAPVLARLADGPVTFEQPFSSEAGERVRVRAVAVTRPNGRYVVVVGSSLATTEAALDRVRTAAAVAGVAVVLLASLGAWLLAGAALRPVERLRAAVAAVPPDQPGRALQVPETHDELAALARTMNQLLGRISQALERERRLIADASHELRSPLTVLRTELELANQPARSRAELAESVSHAAAEADRVARLADDLLFLARTDQGGPVVHPVRQLLRPVLAGALTAAAGRAAAKGVRLELEVDGGLQAPIDVDRLRQAADNLLDNALRVAPPGSTVRIRAERRDGLVAVAVSDAGPGFPADFLPHAFERFRRADPSRTRRHGGAGLGLAIVEAIARGHGGRAEAVNLPDGGAEVRLLLPGSWPPEARA